MNNSPLQVGLDISQKRLDMCVMQPNGAVLMNHRSLPTIAMVMKS